MYVFLEKYDKYYMDTHSYMVLYDTNYRKSTGDNLHEISKPVFLGKIFQNVIC